MAFKSAFNASEVRDHIPLEQGLRQNKFETLANRFLSETIFH